MALDPGAERVGVAISDPTATIATPLTVISRRPHSKFLLEIASLVAQHQPERLVVGLPLTLDGRKGPSAQRALAIASELKKVISIPITTVNESYTTLEALDILQENGITSQKVREKKVDSLSAALILERYLKVVSRNNI
jgi:putative Holliday junction resolvase